MMNEYYPEQFSGTPASTSILVGTMMTASLFVDPNALPDDSRPNSEVMQSAYTLSHLSSTTSQQRYLTSDHRINAADKEFIETVSAFYANLSSKQKPLGSEFEKVLSDNLWDLYGS